MKTDKQIQQDVRDVRVMLTGRVRSLAEWEDAGAAAWAGPGVTAVDNKLQVKLEVFAY